MAATLRAKMAMRKTFLGLLSVMLAVGVPVFGGTDRDSFTEAIVKLNREATVIDLTAMVQREFGTREEEIRWAVNESMEWGEIIALAYIQATTGRSFAEMTQEDARRDLWTYAEKTEMSLEKMARSLESFLKRAERERNTRIFERLRSSRRVHSLPDLGSGFGLFQEALDFRRIDSPRPTKIHTGTGVLAKGEK